MKHPFLQNKHLPDWSEMRPEAIEPDISKAIADAERSIEALLALKNSGSAYTYENTFVAFEEGMEGLNTAWGFVNHLDSVNNSKNLRKAYNAMLPKVTQFFTDIPLNDALWSVLKTSAESLDWEALSPIEQRHIEETLADFREDGADLCPEKKAELRQIQKDLAERTQKYSENCLDATHAWDYSISDEAMLKGLPNSAIQAAEASAKKKAASKNESSAPEEKTWRFTLDATSFSPAITYAEDAGLRKTLWEAYQSLGRSAPYENQDILKEILVLRHRYAKLLGKEDFAEQTTHRRMVKSGAAASQFIAEMHGQIQDTFAAEFTELKNYRVERAGETPLPENTLEPWDIAYWADQHQKEHYDFDEESLRPYFPIDTVIQGLFSISETLFGLSIEPLEAEYIDPEQTGKQTDKKQVRQAEPKSMPELWHPQVQLYQVSDSDSGKLLGHFYADWFPRESKRSGAWMNYLRTGSKKGSNQPHLGLICGNLTPPLEGQPALLNHGEVETIFHEFGHLLHHLCGSVPVASLNGVNVAWDFVELPSQIMENWCWERESLDRFARHYETDEPIPEALFQKMLACRNHFKAMGTMRQLCLAKLDLDLHRDWVLDPERPIDNYLEDRLSNYQLKLKTRPRPPTCNFGHLFSSPTGYAAGYYSYKWAEVLDADAFTRFQEEGLLNPETGRSFRECILAKGNSEDPYQLFMAFMGRAPKSDALLRRDGILH